MLKCSAPTLQSVARLRDNSWTESLRRTEELHLSLSLYLFWAVKRVMEWPQTAAPAGSTMTWQRLFLHAGGSL